MQSNELTPVLNPMQTQQLSSLFQTVNELTADSITTWHQALGQEIRDATDQIQRLTVIASQNMLVEELVKTFDQNQQAILNALELPLRTIQKLVESGHPSDSQKLKLLIQLGITHELLTQWDIALDQFHRALDYCQDDLSTKAMILKRIGSIKSRQGDYSGANRQYQISLKIYSELQQLYQVAQMYINIGWNDFQAENYQSAEANYQKAREIAESTEGTERLLADFYLNMGILKTVKGEFETALSYFEQSIEVYISLDDERGLALAYYNMAMLCVDIKEWEKAGEFYQKSLEYAQKLSHLHLMGHIYLSWTELALKLGDLVLAQSCCMHAIKTFGRLGSQPQLADAYKFAGQIQHRQENWAKAELFFQKSIKTAQACGSGLNQAEAHYEYGLMLVDKPDPEQAKSQLNEALKLFTTLEAKADIERTRALLAGLDSSQETTDSEHRFKRIRRS
jgi:tetratricopeptide (TPR) repeat protein